MATSIMMRLRKLVFIVFIAFVFVTCESKQTSNVNRAMDPWAFRSVLNKQPRMLTLALDSACYVAYDLSSSTLYSAWKGGVTLEGTVYTDKKNVQPSSWGTPYFADSLRQTSWSIQKGDKREPLKAVNKGYVIQDNRITLNYALINPSGDTIQIEERPEFVRDGTGRPGLER